MSTSRKENGGRTLRRYGRALYHAHIDEMLARHVLPPLPEWGMPLPLLRTSVRYACSPRFRAVRIPFAHMSAFVSTSSATLMSVSWRGASVYRARTRVVGTVGKGGLHRAVLSLHVKQSRIP